MFHFSKCVGVFIASSFPIILRDKNINNVPKFCNNIAADSRKVLILHSIHQTGGFARVRKKVCNPHTSKDIYFEQNIPMSQGLVTMKRRSSIFLAHIRFHWAHRPWSQRKLRVQKNAWIAQNLSSRKLIEMRSNNNQNWKYDAQIPLLDKIYQNM